MWYIIKHTCQITSWFIDSIYTWQVVDKYIEMFGVHIHRYTTFTTVGMHECVNVNHRQSVIENL